MLIKNLYLLFNSMVGELKEIKHFKLIKGLNRLNPIQDGPFGATHGWRKRKIKKYKSCDTTLGFH